MKAMVTISRHPIVFGVPVETFGIPGYACIFREDEFAKARDLKPGGDDPFISEFPDRYELWACKYDGQKTAKNPRGEYVVAGAAIVIPK
jgi:hypothetical protein